MNAVDGETQGAAPCLPAPCFLPPFMGDEVGAYEGVVLAVQGSGAGAMAGRLGGVRGGRRRPRPSGVGETATSGAGEQKFQQWGEGSGDTVNHVVNSM